jgi:uncharacterized protein YceK
MEKIPTWEAKLFAASQEITGIIYKKSTIMFIYLLFAVGLTLSGSSTVHIYTQQYTVWHPVAAVQYKFTHKQYTGWHSVAEVLYTFTHK